MNKRPISTQIRFLSAQNESIRGPHRKCNHTFRKKKKKKNVANFGPRGDVEVRMRVDRYSSTPPKNPSAVSAQHQQNTFLGASSRAFDML